MFFLFFIPSMMVVFGVKTIFFVSHRRTQLNASFQNCLLNLYPMKKCEKRGEGRSFSSTLFPIMKQELDGLPLATHDPLLKSKSNWLASNGDGQRKAVSCSFYIEGSEKGLKWTLTKIW